MAALQPVPNDSVSEFSASRNPKLVFIDPAGLKKCERAKGGEVCPDSVGPRLHTGDAPASLVVLGSVVLESIACNRRMSRSSVFASLE